jgi:hypothetical protein
MTHMTLVGGPFPAGFAGDGSGRQGSAERLQDGGTPREAVLPEILDEPT